MAGSQALQSCLENCLYIVWLFLEKPMFQKVCDEDFFLQCAVVMDMGSKPVFWFHGSEKLHWVMCLFRLWMQIQQGFFIFFLIGHF